MASPRNEADFSDERHIASRPGSRMVPDHVWDVARSAVVMIDTVQGGRGSGFLATLPLSNNCSVYLVTCQHVLETKELASKSNIYFNRVNDDGVRITAKDLLNLDVFRADKGLDYCIVGIKEGVLVQKGLDIKPLQLCSVDDSEHFREGYTAYIIHHPGRGYGPVSMARSSNSCIIISFKEPIIAHQLNTEPGSSGSPLLITSRSGEFLVCGLHLGSYPDANAPALFNRALYIHTMCQHLQSGQRPTDKIDAVAQDIADQLSEMNLGVGVPLFIRLDGISSSIEKSCIILACEQHVPGMVHTVSFQRERRTATVKFKTKQATREVAEKDSLTINGRRIGITLEEDPMENKIRHCSPEKTVLVSKIPPANVVSQQHFELYMSNLLRGTDNILDLCQRNDSKALVVFASCCAGEIVLRLGNPHTHRLVDTNNRPYKIQGEQLPPPDGVFVKNIITEGLRSFESITRYFNNEHQSGGKGVQSVFIGPNRGRIVLFKDSETVNSVMVRDHSEMLGEEVEVYRFCSQLAEWTKGAPCRVELIRGTLETCKTEAYVNSPPSNLCLDNGPIAKSLRDAGGPSFVEACKRYVREKGDIGVGCVGTTVGGNLQCKHVIHAVGMQYKGSDSERSMGQLVQKVLDECERLQVQSVAIPPLGAGTLKFPNSHDIIVRSLNTFLSSGACRSLKKIVLVDCEDLHNFRKSLERLM